MKIATIVGTRPHFIKAAPVSQAIEAAGLREIIIHTGQHYSDNMDRVFFDELGLAQPHYRFDVNNAGHGRMVGRMVEAVTTVLADEKPEWVLVYGDTNTSLAGALAAKILGLKLVHVEAGLRSFDPSMQEEVNRVLIDRISDLLVCPTDKAMSNLRAEGFPLGSGRMVNCGDVMLDAARLFATRAYRPSGMAHISPDSFFLATVHRAENTNHLARLESIFTALETLARDRPVVLPLHPRTRKVLEGMDYDFSASALTMIEPVGYLEILWLLENCALLVTDGGGLQKEAYFMSSPCVTLRNSSEWTELLDIGANVLADADTAVIVKSVDTMLGAQIDFNRPLYGNGDAAERMVQEIIEYSAGEKR
ncbi:MAG: UDP-N-acetylglucosamine 2-epimerase (non-hydrolyzing) [Myxococcota bacterium]|nr:UDP-N-acetylglucosamine 2-epimerase (non-hydrolyzing) [Myxococcota bacterium]